MLKCFTQLCLEIFLPVILEYDLNEIIRHLIFFLFYVVDVCVPNPCGTQGTCAQDTQNINGYTCTCDAGWSGPTCQTGKSG